MAPKRTIGNDDISGREKKKLKMSAARTIAVQGIGATKPVEKTTPGSQQAGCEWSVDMF